MSSFSPIRSTFHDSRWMLKIYLLFAIFLKIQSCEESVEGENSGE